MPVRMGVVAGVLAGHAFGRGGVVYTERMALALLSLELTNRCAKACWFCYNHSQPAGATCWHEADVIAFVRDCAAQGVKAVSFGGGEPLQYPGLWAVLTALDGVLFRSLTTNGLQLDDALPELIAANPNKVHVSLHFPERAPEVDRVTRQVHALAEAGIKSGVNLLVMRSQLAAATSAATRLRERGIGNERIVYLPMRGIDTPTPSELAVVAGNQPFQSMTCLRQCAPSPRFVAVAWDQTVGWCSYTTTRRRLPALTYAGLQNALTGLGLTFCGKDEAARRPLPVLT